MLENIFSPTELQKLNLNELNELAVEIRQLIISTVSKTGGHLAPSLGTVELTLALFNVFNLDNDQIVWDVGHQSYTHKILTNRRERFKTLRTLGGISGFPKRSESKYDAFGVGHASTSISAALGLSIANEINNRKNHVIAVIGDGALTGGESFEALNHAGQLKKNLIVVLNDNEMSIDKNVGALSEYLSQIRLTPRYRQAKKDFESLVKRIPISSISDRILSTANSIKFGVKSAISAGGLFEALGFVYIGPVDGHDIKAMQETFKSVKEQFNEPVLIHVHTTKGKGYAPAEESPDKFHGVGRFDVATGEVEKKLTPPTYTSVFSRAVLDCAKGNEKLVAITAAMPSGTGLKTFSEMFPQRFFDVGIAEEHALTLAAGMAAGGLHPIVALYSTFAQRGYDQLLHDICLQNLPLTLCLDRAGLVGEDGPTHHGVFDLSYLRHMPNMSVLAPKDENELRQMIFAAVEREAPIAIRYPRGAGTGATVIKKPLTLPWGRSELISRFNGEADAAIFAVGSMVGTALKAADLLKSKRIYANVINVRFVKPLDEEMLIEQSKAARLLVTCEENVLIGGYGSAAAECLIDHGITKPLMRLGIGDRFVEHGSRDKLLEICGLSPERIAASIEEKLNRKSGVNLKKSNPASH